MVDLVWDGSQRCCLFALVVGVVCLYVCACVVGCCLLYLVLVWAVFGGCVCWWWLLCNLFCSLALLGVGCVVIFDLMPVNSAVIVCLVIIGWCLLTVCGWCLLIGFGFVVAVSVCYA